MRELNPKLIKNPGPEIIVNRLKDYLLIDSVPRTKRQVVRELENIDRDEGFPV